MAASPKEDHQISKPMPLPFCNSEGMATISESAVSASTKQTTKQPSHHHVVQNWGLETRHIYDTESYLLLITPLEN